MDMHSYEKVSIDASTICQLKCPECSTSKGIIKNGIIGSGFLKFDNLVSFVNRNNNIAEIELSNWGEIFLNPEFIQIIKYAFENNIKLSAGNGVNFNTLSDEVIEALVKFKFAYLNISIDGACHETYSKYRIGGDFEKVMMNISKLNNYKKIYNTPFPKLAWQFIIFGHNEHEIPIIKKMSFDLDMVFNPRLNHSDFSPIKNQDWVRQQSGLEVASRDEFKSKFNRNYKRPCCQLWVSPQISWDGKLLGCCVNKWVSFGNVFENDFKSCIASSLYESTKLALSGKIQLKESMPCFHCKTFQQIGEQPITESEISIYSKFVHPAEKQ